MRADLIYLNDGALGTIPVGGRSGGVNNQPDKITRIVYVRVTLVILIPFSQILKPCYENEEDTKYRTSIIYVIWHSPI